MTHGRVTAVALAAALSAAVALGGCGHSQSGPGRGPTGAYRAQADRICVATNNEMEAHTTNNEMEAHKVPDQQAEIMRLAAFQRATLAQVRAVTPPPSIRSQAGSWLGSAELATKALGDWSKNLADHAQLVYTWRYKLRRRRRRSAPVAAGATVPYERASRTGSDKLRLWKRPASALLLPRARSLAQLLHTATTE